MSKRALCVTAGALAAAAWAVHRLARRSGVSPDEARQALPGDGIVSAPSWVSTRALTIAAPPSEVWPWVVQMGYPTERAGWYTPHWLDELMWGERPRSAETIRPELQDLEVGDQVPDSPDWTAKYVVEEVEPPSHLVLHSTWHVWGPVRSSDFSWVFVLKPVEESLPTGERREATRLVVRARVAYEPTWIYPFVETVIGLGDWANVSVMLRGIKRRAEAAAS
ncbi:MAG TPA: SRPBCC family protein [Thermoleophilia bacterium]|nr:SRPBCC family protein [Thermoleophilia bacterium]